MNITFEKMLEKITAEGRARRLVIAGSHSEHALEAVLAGVRAGIVTPIFCGRRDDTLKILKQLGGEDIAYVMRDCASNNTAVAAAIECIHNGEADFIMKGQMDTSEIMGPALKRENGLRTSATVVNALGFAEIETHHKMLAVTDGSICVAPDLEQKRWMIQNSVDAMRKMGWACPYVACLAALEKVNPKMQATVDAADLQRMNEEQKITGCVVEGPLAFDCAIDKASAEVKGLKSRIAGEADLLLFPDLQAANIGIKIIIGTGRNKVGTAVIGLKVPIVMSSRGGSTGTKFRSLLVAASMC
ncbi:phosphate butyryltransferase [Deltaproteobacteria bacterium]|nr:phosphate butyryltransferase [Deltaproteobacteria bacterium]